MSTQASERKRTYFRTNANIVRRAKLELAHIGDDQIPVVANAFHKHGFDPGLHPHETNCENNNNQRNQK
jgi:hypothetical protein